MKTILLLVTLAIIAAPQSHAQGTVNFANNTATRVYYQPSVGGATTSVPVGSQFLAELMYAPDGAADFDSVAVRLGATASFGPVAGLFSGGARTAPIATAGGFGLFQVRVWESAYGSSYQDALGRTCNLGKSAILRVDTGDPTTNPPGTPSPLTGLSSFVLMAVGPPCPEPSTYALGALAAAALVLFRRTKRT